MPESFTTDIQQRAYRAMLKLQPDQLEYLERFLYPGKSLQVEESYHTLTGCLLEPVIARYWIDCKKIPVKKPARKALPYTKTY